MKKRRLWGSARAKTAVTGHSKASIGAAVLFALYGAPHPAGAQQQTAAQDQASAETTTLQEVVVTANRRQQTLEEVPYSVTAVSADQLAGTGVTDIASLTNQVPGLSLYNLGARETSAINPIIRGINITAAPFSYLNFRTLEQSPVGVYIGNSPIDGYFQLEDVQRVEVLRGPQGTLYGAGALGGALRIIPNSPELDKFTGSVEAGVGTVAHSDQPSWTTDGVVNIPLGDTFAFRASGKYDYLPGFIHAYGILERPGSAVSGIPTLADPGDVVNSPGVFTNKNDWNYEATFTGRGSFLWKPVSEFSAELAYTYSHLDGDGGPVANNQFPGGPYPIDPRITFPPGGNYTAFVPVDQPYRRATDLTSLDLSYDAGFATLSATTSYYTTNGSTELDQTYGLVGVNQSVPGFVEYYAGLPINPRYVNPSFFQDAAHTFTQEIRLVSNTAPDKLFDYVLGVFYEHQTTDGAWAFSNPGSPERSVAQGCTAPYFLGDTFPNCLVIANPEDVHFYQSDEQLFKDRSVFGEFTWHFLPHAQITVGGRHFQQDFTDTQAYLLYYAFLLLPAHAQSTSTSKNTGKIDVSYEYAKNQHVYALWSQGFRRGGANALPLSGLFAENPVLLTYKPDTANNYEVGLKGRFDNGLTYAFDVFDIEWDNPQVAGTLPTGNLAVWNASHARSSGFEVDFSSPLFVPGLTLLLGGSYAEAKFTENYFYAADSFGNVVGSAGQQLPGSPKISTVATLNYDRPLVPGYDLRLSLNDTYRSDIWLGTFPSAVLGETAPLHAPGMNLVNLSAVVKHAAWRTGVYVTNLADRRVVQAPPESPNRVGDLTDLATINQPRTIMLKVGYAF
jgi:iron complex outermembrane recepter protein